MSRNSGVDNHIIIDGDHISNCGKMQHPGEHVKMKTLVWIQPYIGSISANSWVIYIFPFCNP